MSRTDPFNTIIQFVEHNGKITNRECRQLLNISYDDAIFLLGGLCKTGILLRMGTHSVTHYILSGPTVSKISLDNLREDLLKNSPRRNSRMERRSV